MNIASRIENEPLIICRCSCTLNCGGVDDPLRCEEGAADGDTDANTTDTALPRSIGLLLGDPAGENESKRSDPLPAASAASAAASRSGNSHGHCGVATAALAGPCTTAAAGRGGSGGGVG
ncbi:unnamed protein product, partial [Ectocarpus sp. 8 AP-2014]